MRANPAYPLIEVVNDPELPLDDNLSENALRPVALGRKNDLFVGSDEAGENTAGLYSLIATCEANGVNRQAYLADVLIRVQHHPASRIDELLPHRWGQARPARRRRLSTAPAAPLLSTSDHGPADGARVSSRGR
jgi:hypothetical protein